MQILFKFQVNQMKNDDFRNLTLRWPLLFDLKTNRLLSWDYLYNLLKFHDDRFRIVTCRRLTDKQTDRGENITSFTFDGGGEHNLCPFSVAKVKNTFELLPFVNCKFIPPGLYERESSMIIKPWYHGNGSVAPFTTKPRPCYSHLHTISTWDLFHNEEASS